MLESVKISMYTFICWQRQTLTSIHALKYPKMYCQNVQKDKIVAIKMGFIHPNNSNKDKDF